MKNRLIIFVASLVFCFSSLSAVIIETRHFKEIVSHATPGSLIILDIDDTLLITPQMLGCDNWFAYRWNKYEQEGLSKAKALEKSLAEWEAVRHLTKMELVEPGIQNVVRALQAQGHTVIGLTTQGLALATRTVLQLKDNDIDLSLTPMGEANQYLEVNGHGILYRNGIFFTSGKPKGEALFALCEKLRYKPKKIVFINDKASHLADIETAAKQHGVEFIGLRYAYSDARKAAFRIDVAEFQFSHSTFDHILSDEEAIEMMSRTWIAKK